LTRTKNAANIVMKNLSDFTIGTIAYWLVGFAIMFGAGNALFGTSGFLTSAEGFDLPLPVPVYFIFQAVFAGTAATIVSGAVAERMKFPSYLIFSFVISALIYPVVGHWIWGGGWLASRAVPFHDFAGSTVVHMTGGVAALMGAALLGPRLGKYRQGKPQAIPGHSIPLAMVGVFVLWFGWFGFNGGSTLGATGQGELIGHVLLTTNLAAAAGAAIATLVIWLVSGKPDVAMAGNGALAGLVGITAGCAFVGPLAAIGVGAVAGALVVGSVLFLDRIRIDDPVGAVSVHGTCGVLGTIWVGLFADPALGLDGAAGLFKGGGTALLTTQVIGVLAVGAWVAIAAGLVFVLLKVTVGIRVSAEEEMEGLDIHEHGLWGYPEIMLGPDLGPAAGGTPAGGRARAPTPAPR
ncbi:MAG: ammonium transporter, partial [Actinomycetota bacterium]|nr:ammonium transporter [Actinomycetota bacterium]